MVFSYKIEIYAESGAAYGHFDTEIWITVSIREGEQLEVKKNTLFLIVCLLHSALFKVAEMVDWNGIGLS